MLVAEFAAFGGPSDVEITERPDPEPGPAEVVLEVAASALNHHDLLLLEGEMWFDESDLPFVSGIDVAGVVRETGSAVEGFERGGRVLLCPNQTCGTCRYCAEGPETLCAEFSLFHGGFAELAVVPAHRLIPLSTDADIGAAATLPVSYVTAYQMLRRAAVEPGDLLFVPGATGGVGVAAVQLAAVMGVKTIGTLRSAAKLDRVERLGATHTIQGDDPAELERAVTDRRGGRGPEPSRRAVHGPRTVGAATGWTDGGVCRTTGGRPEIDIWDLFRTHKHVVGSTMGTQGDLERLVDLFEEGKLSPVVGAEYSLERTTDAFRDIADRDVFGKSVVVP